MSYSAPNPDYDVDAALLDIIVQSEHPAVKSGPAAEALARIEKQYQDCIQALEDRNAALVKEGEAKGAEIERLETEVCALEGDLVTLETVLRDTKLEMKGVFVQTHIVPETKVVLRVGEEMWSGIFKHA